MGKFIKRAFDFLLALILFIPGAIVLLYRLNFCQPNLLTPLKALDALNNVDRSTLEYSPSQCFRSLSNTMVNYYDRYQIELSADDIIITCGGSEAVN